ncbi:MAG: hypothetical protein KAT39_14450, partial [Alphaproteobacteria bacterium]|nr:hypothetical protein [Alphaproteobacteria bacterium]
MSFPNHGWTCKKRSASLKTKGGLLSGSPFFIFMVFETVTDIKSHHMIYGTLTDYVTGKKIVDTDDERYRQKLCRMMVEQKGYRKNDLEVGTKIETLFNGTFVVSKIDIVVKIHGQRLLVIRYGPGSLVTRERPALAAARV